eukprot:gnl/TRDRNA2_/TRDRNA2_37950_c0_seq1.p1 gnl/TRDRNA2_/TRDRNA2_37950_c0~~gnl/TRDRNA2_/TRDRNA2_37950_c0_seq1.p1  ORF type:complete len:714 (+),score=172.76 gnl/TRDRNA2_/TRDRNA2_37950_c0_seq1:43-2184(+)
MLTGSKASKASAAVHDQTGASVRALLQRNGVDPVIIAYLQDDEPDGLAFLRMAEFGHYFTCKDELRTLVIDEIESLKGDSPSEERRRRKQFALLVQAWLEAAKILGQEEIEMLGKESDEEDDLADAIAMEEDAVEVAEAKPAAAVAGGLRAAPVPQAVQMPTPKVGAAPLPKSRAKLGGAPPAKATAQSAKSSVAPVPLAPPAPVGKDGFLPPANRNSKAYKREREQELPPELATAKADLNNACMKLSGGNIAKDDIQYLVMEQGGLYMVTLRLNCLEGIEFVGEPKISRREAECNVAAQALESLADQLAALRDNKGDKGVKRRKKAKDADGKPQEAAEDEPVYYDTTTNPKTMLNAFCQIAAGKSMGMGKDPLRYSTEQVGGKYLATVTLPMVLGSKSYTGQMCNNQKAAEQAAAAAAIEANEATIASVGPLVNKNPDWVKAMKGRTKPKKVEHPLNPANFTQDGDHNNHKTNLSTVVTKMLKRSVTKGDVTYESVQVQGGEFQSTLTMPSLPSPWGDCQWVGSTAATKVKAEQYAAGEALQALMSDTALKAFLFGDQKAQAQRQFGRMPPPGGGYDASGPARRKGIGFGGKDKGKGFGGKDNGKGKGKDFGKVVAPPGKGKGVPISFVREGAGAESSTAQGAVPAAVGKDSGMKGAGMKGGGKGDFFAPGRGSMYQTGSMGGHPGIKLGNVAVLGKPPPAAGAAGESGTPS